MVKMNKLRAIIVEDEAPARDLIKAFLKNHENIELIGECDNGFDGVKHINDLKPDLVFLDIQFLPLENKKPSKHQFVFLAAYELSSLTRDCNELQ